LLRVLSSSFSLALIAQASLAPYVAPTANRKITEWIALGDSYSAGVGLDERPDYIDHSLSCSRYKEAFPMQMQADPRMPGDLDARAFTFGSCTGARISDVVAKQVDSGPSSNEEYTKFGPPQIASLSISGNAQLFLMIVSFVGDSQATAGKRSMRAH